MFKRSKNWEGSYLKKINWKVVGICFLTIFLIILIAFIIKESAENKKSKKVAWGIPKTACQMFTSFNAKVVMGQSARRSGKAVSNKSTAGLLETDCPYTNGSVSGNLNVKSPQTEQAYKDLENDFTTTYNEISDSDRVKAYGGRGFWDGKTGKLYIFNKKTLFTVTYGSSDPAARNLPQTEELADIFIRYTN